MKATVSAIVPVRNRPEVIHRALDSILAQTRPVDEIIVVDDGSDDDTAAQVAARAIPQLKLIRLPQSGGAPRARNAGVAAASGAFLAFLDSDDAWVPTKIEKQLGLLLEHPECPAAACGMTFRFRKRGARTMGPPALIEYRDMREFNIVGGTSVGLVRRDAFDAVGGFTPDLPACQDWDMWLRLAQLGPLCAVTEPLVDYFFDGSERITKGRDRVLTGHQRIFDGIYARIDDARELRRIKAAHATRLSNIFARHHFEPALALRYAGRAFLLEPSLRRAFDLPVVLAKLSLYGLT